jgi:transcriptional regulator with XRE-family HTH domain
MPGRKEVELSSNRFAWSPLGAKLRELRRRARWSLTKLAVEAGLGVNGRAYLSKIEHGAIRHVSQERLEVLARTLNVPVTELIAVNIHNEPADNATADTISDMPGDLIEQTMASTDEHPMATTFEREDRRRCDMALSHGNQQPVLMPSAGQDLDLKDELEDVARENVRMISALGKTTAIKDLMYVLKCIRLRHSGCSVEQISLTCGIPADNLDRLLNQYAPSRRVPSQPALSDPQRAESSGGEREDMVPSHDPDSTVVRARDEVARARAVRVGRLIRGFRLSRRRLARVTYQDQAHMTTLEFAARYSEEEQHLFGHSPIRGESYVRMIERGGLNLTREHIDIISAALDLTPLERALIAEAAGFEGIARYLVLSAGGQIPDLGSLLEGDASTAEMLRIAEERIGSARDGLLGQGKRQTGHQRQA